MACTIQPIKGGAVSASCVNFTLPLKWEYHIYCFYYTKHFRKWKRH